MSVSSFARLKALSDREYRTQATGSPEPIPGHKTFRPKKLSLGRYDNRWDRKRGTAMRLTGVLLRDNEEAMHARVCSVATRKVYASAAEWLAHEASLLRKTAKMHETAVARLSAVLARCDGEAQAS